MMSRKTFVDDLQFAVVLVLATFAFTLIAGALLSWAGL